MGDTGSLLELAQHKPTLGQHPWEADGQLPATHPGEVRVWGKWGRGFWGQEKSGGKNDVGLAGPSFLRS